MPITSVTNNTAILFGDLLQLGAGAPFGAGTTQVSTITFGSVPSAGVVAFGFWGLQTADINTAAGVPLGPAVTTAINNMFGTAYTHPFTATLSGSILTITADTTGPFAYMPLPAFTVAKNTSLVTVTPLITVPGVTQETYATVNGVEMMPWPGVTTDVETYLTLDPGTNGFKRKVAKFSDAGQAQFTVNMTNDAQQNAVTGFRFMARQKQTYNWRIVEPTKTVGAGIIIPGSTYYGAAFVTKFVRNGNTPDSRQRWDGTLDWDGDVLEFPPLS